MTKTKKRYTSEEQIIKRIDEVHTRHRRLLWEAEQDERNGYKEYADIKRRKADRLIEVRAKQLSRRLAEFRTAILPGIVEDESMPVKLG